MNTENNYVETDLGNISPNPCGEYNPSMQYEYLDLVNYQGGSYLCTVELENKITGIAPVQGKNTECWQLVTLPGDLTPEYIAMHDDVVNKAKQVEASTAAAELARQEAELALADVEQLHSDTVSAANRAAESRDSAAGYAQTAEVARDKVKESEENVNAQVTGFDTHVAEKTQQSERALADARQQAVQTITKQQELSVQAVKDETAEYIEEQKNTAKEEINSHADEKIEEINQAYKPLDEKVELLNEDVDTLKNDTKELNDKKITKFYASNQGETHLADSDNGKIMDMMLYGKSEQFTTTGKNLLKIRDGAQTTRGVTVTAKDGVFVLKGTATETGWAIFDVVSFVLDGTCILSSNISTGVKVANKSFKPVLEQNKSVTLENAEVSKVCFLIEEGKTYDISNILVQLEKGSVVTSYEPYTGGQPSPSPDYPQEIKSIVNPTVKVSNEDGTKSQTVTLPYTLNAIPVSSGGNVTIDGQQYIADYVDVERGKYVQMIQTDKVQSNITWIIQKQSKGYSLGYSNLYKNSISTNKPGMGKAWKSNVGDSSEAWRNAFSFGKSDVFWIVPYENDGNITSDDINAWLVEHPMDIMYPLAEPIETDLTLEENEAFKALVTNYPVTNISVTSDQLDGYTVFNYQINMVNGWNYVKQQIGDTREYIYDIDARTQDTDLQAAEAYVNSEYAVALTELEV